MLQDGLILADGSPAVNLQIDNGDTLPSTDNNLGELYYLTSGTEGLYIYDGAGWIQVGSNFDASASNTITGTWSFSNPLVVATPTLDTHATTKAYVDSVAAGLDPKASVRLATIGNMARRITSGCT